ncbi:MAG: hypothetical protein EYC71_09645 [Gammaproteobacteria bacterium]|nr:MAG: hypothetical protein EYC71_09645 [Gammaproteobacteria bacterium]
MESGAVKLPADGRGVFLRAQVYAYVNGTHHLDNIDGNARSYDANGNTTYNPDTLSSTFVYDDRNRLEAMSGSPQGLYRYNARGERLIKQSGFMNFGLKERVSSYDEQGKLVAYLDYEYDNRGRRLLKGSYDLVYLDDLPVAMLSKGKISYLETDHLGTSRLAVDSVTHAEQWSWDFFADAFGANDAIVNDGKVDLPLRYPGQQYDAESGLHYNYFRDYEPGTGRYIESDPIGLVGGAATFLYANGSPAIFADLKGGIPEPGFLIPPNYRNSTIVCDGRGGIEPYIPLNPFDMECIGDCIRLHELIHVRDFKAANPWVCRGQKQFTRINEFDEAELWRSERNAYTESLRCLKIKLESEMSNPCPACRIRLESEIEKHEKELDRFTR